MNERVFRIWSAVGAVAVAVAIAAVSTMPVAAVMVMDYSTGPARVQTLADSDVSFFGERWGEAWASATDLLGPAWPLVAGLLVVCVIAHVVYARYVWRHPGDPRAALAKGTETGLMVVIGSAVVVPCVMAAVLALEMGSGQGGHDALVGVGILALAGLVALAGGFITVAGGCALFVSRRSLWRAALQGGRRRPAKRDDASLARRGNVG